MDEKITLESLQTASLDYLIGLDWAGLAQSNQALHRAGRRRLHEVLNQQDGKGHEPYHPPKKKIFVPDSWIH